MGESLADTVGGASALGWQKAKVDPALAQRPIEDVPNRIFGYGSLVWRAGMTYIKRRPAEVFHKQNNIITVHICFDFLYDRLIFDF
mgnify:CR=1 FL=1